MIKRKVADLVRMNEGRKQVVVKESPAVLTGEEVLGLERVSEGVGRKGEKVKVNDKMIVEPLPLNSFATGTLLTTKQVCRMFNVTGMTIYHWVNQLGLPKIRLAGGKNPPVRYDEGVVREWARLKQRTVVNEDFREWL